MLKQGILRILRILASHFFVVLGLCLGTDVVSASGCLAAIMRDALF